MTIVLFNPTTSKL